jgi:demethoxyubiquinone hydroxylase (CLK1/Coq7/Cat5 family)
MLRRVALVRTEVSKEHSASIVRVTRIGEVGMLAVTSNRRTLRRNTNLRLTFLRNVDSYKNHTA